MTQAPDEREAIVPRSAQQGTMMLKRADVLGRLTRWRIRYLNNMHSADVEGNEDWRQWQLHKVRAVQSLFEDICERCPVFENPAKAVEVEKPVRRIAADAISRGDHLLSEQGEAT